MKKENARRCAEVLFEIDNLSKYKKILACKTAHFALRQHFGDDSSNVAFNEKYNSRFLAVVEEILKELDNELESL